MGLTEGYIPKRQGSDGEGNPILVDGIDPTTIVTGAGGSDTQLQFNDGGDLAGITGAIWNSVTTTIELANGVHLWSKGAGTDSVALGPFTTAIGTRGHAIGYSAGATGDDSTVVGANANSTGVEATVIGSSALSTHARAVCIGYDATSNTSGQLVVGADTDVTKVRFGDGTAPIVWTNPVLAPLSINTRGTSTYTLFASDNGKTVVFTSGSAVTLTVPSGLGAGFNCNIVQKGAGQITLSASGVTINNRQSHTKTAGQGSIATLFADVANNFYFQGDTA